MEIEQIITSDGSHSLFSKTYNEIYHSKHGAIGESNHVFIKNGLHTIQSKDIKIFEVGFGTGLNPLLALAFGFLHGKNICYEGVELHPLAMDVVHELNYPKMVMDGKFESAFNAMHSCTWNEKHWITSFFCFHKTHGSILQIEPKQNYFDLIFFDAFAPAIQADLWTEEVMQKMYSILVTGGKLSTYCAKGEVRRTLQKVGFTTERLPGPPGKREMLVATK